MDISKNQLLEALLYQVPSIRHIYELIGIRGVLPVKHPGQQQTVKNFQKPYVILAIGAMTDCYIIERKSTAIYHVITIGTQVTYSRMGRPLISEQCLDLLKLHRQIPEPIFKKLVFIIDYEEGKLKGTILHKYPSLEQGMVFAYGKRKLGKNMEDNEDYWCTEDGRLFIKRFLTYLPTEKERKEGKRLTDVHSELYEA